MFLKFHELKQIIYIGQSILGVILLLIAVFHAYLATTAINPFFDILIALILFTTGSVCLFFGIETYLLRDDSDIWR